jgi:hypothetical protein
MADLAADADKYAADLVDFVLAAMTRPTNRRQ